MTLSIAIAGAEAASLNVPMMSISSAGIDPLFLRGERFQASFNTDGTFAYNTCIEEMITCGVSLTIQDIYGESLTLSRGTFTVGYTYLFDYMGEHGLATTAVLTEQVEDPYQDELQVELTLSYSVQPTVDQVRVIVGAKYCQPANSLDNISFHGGRSYLDVVLLFQPLIYSSLQLEGHLFTEADAFTQERPMFADIAVTFAVQNCELGMLQKMGQNEYERLGFIRITL